MVSFTKDDRGHNDLERMNDDKDNTITTLKQDNKLLAKQVEDLIEQKKQLLDNQSKKWYNRTMKNIMIALLVLCFTATVGNTNETKTITPKEFGIAIVETPAKVANFISNEVEKTKEYQKKSWADSKIQFANTKATIKSWFVKN